ncbi:Sodium/hydrogen exchanger family-domain-containing protein [Thelonectria olida]|uniref:Sodium/hydrogen exchanger family-domain-containing protein n=1 Tax=Thelonectria olida TaxID=1576542 RepID=A0A9P9AQK4_9HYPO|nr:Sodium/hydrogen exchanger family-domain-containing protein [Thelonectria olida]
MASSVPYHEPSIEVISILSGFLLTLNIVNYGLDKVAFCGLLGQVLLGIAWGTPGGKLLNSDVENAVMQLGYLGLILIVYEGGLATSFKSMKANLWLSTGVAMTGIAIPIGLSFTLQPMMGATPLQAFTAGAALCSTSLGTTFTILGTSGLSATRLGVVLTSAAMIDDVVGLILVQVVSNLGGDEFDPVIVIRPVIVSLAFAVVVPVLCRFVVLPATLKLNSMRESSKGSKLASFLKLRQTAFIVHTALLLALVIAGTFAGTSSLLAAYVAGAAVSWWDSEVPHVQCMRGSSSEAQGPASDPEDTQMPSPATPTSQGSLDSREDGDGLGVEVYDCYYKPVVEYVLKPFFFSSIGFSVPVTRMFSGPVVWRGIIYTILMTASKLACGLWLMPFPNPFRGAAKLVRQASILESKRVPLTPGAQCAAANEFTSNQEVQPGTRDSQEGMDENSPTNAPTIRNATPKPDKPKSLYPASIIGLGMVARGEIGFLVASLGESKGIFGHQSNGLFLVIVWAISLCTMIGPICVGLLVNRVRKLESGRGQNGGESSRNVLGAWGVK